MGTTGYYRPEDLELDNMFEGSGVRFCWTNTGLTDGGNYGEVLCGVDSDSLIASATQRTVIVNRFVEGDQDMNQPDNFAFQPKTGNHYVIGDNSNGDIFACLPDGADRDIKTDGCVKILSVKDTSAEPTALSSQPMAELPICQFNTVTTARCRSSTIIRRTTLSRSLGLRYQTVRAVAGESESHASRLANVACAPRIDHAQLYNPSPSGMFPRSGARAAP